MEKAAKEKGEHGTAPGGGEAKKPAEEGRGSRQGKRYGEAVKRLVVEQIEAGKLTVLQAQRQHGIAGAQTIRGWQEKHGKGVGGVRRASALAAALARIEKLEREKAELERALARSAVRTVVLESAMEEAEAQYGDGFKKKFVQVPLSVRACGSCRKG